MSIAKKMAAMLLCGIMVVSAASTALADGKQSDARAKDEKAAVPPAAGITAAVQENQTSVIPEKTEETQPQDEPVSEPQKVVQDAPVLPEPQQDWPVSVWLNGEAMPLTIPTILENGVTLVSLYDFCTLMGCSVVWENGQAKVTRGNELSVCCTPGEIYLTANGRALYLSTPAKIVNDRVMIPLRVMATVFDMTVEWNGKESRAYLSGGGLLESGDSFYDESQLYWLSRIISAESRGEPLCGQIAVGNVVFNRIADDEFPATVYGVIFDRENGTQFTPTETGTIYDDPKAISVLAAKLCLEGADFSCGATYFISDKVTSCWAMSNKTLVTTIGGHRFYG